MPENQAKNNDPGQCRVSMSRMRLVHKHVCSTTMPAGLAAPPHRLQPPRAPGRWRIAYAGGARFGRGVGRKNYRNQLDLRFARTADRPRDLARRLHFLEDGSEYSGCGSQARRHRRTRSAPWRTPPRVLQSDAAVDVPCCTQQCASTSDASGAHRWQWSDCMQAVFVRKRIAAAGVTQKTGRRYHARRMSAHGAAPIFLFTAGCTDPQRCACYEGSCPRNRARPPGVAHRTIDTPRSIATAACLPPRGAETSNAKGALFNPPSHTIEQRSRRHAEVGWDRARLTAQRCLCPGPGKQRVGQRSCPFVHKQPSPRRSKVCESETPPGLPERGERGVVGAVKKTSRSDRA